MQTETVNQPCTKKRVRCRIFLLVVGLIVLGLLALIGLSYRYYFLHFRQLANTVAAQETQANTLADRMMTLEKQTTPLLSLSQEIDALKTQMVQLAQFKSDQKDSWTIAHARYLIKCANDQIQYTGNISVALKMLQAADAELQGLTQSNALLLRKALAKDMSVLESTPQIDVDGIYARLAALHDEIDQLTIIIPEAKVQPSAAPLTAQSWWQQGLHHTWQSLKQLVIVRYNENQQIPLLPEQKVILKQNLHAAVNQAVWGLLHGQQDIYLASLAQIQAWINKYFVSDTLSQAMLAQTDRLKTLYIRQATPALTALDASANQ